jgi:outer membrane protein
MKRFIALAVSLTSSLVLSAAAQTTPSSAEQAPAKIAIVAFQAAVAQTNEGQRNFADLQKKFDPKRQQLRAVNEEVGTLTKQLQQQSAQLSDSEKTVRAKAIEDKKKQLVRDAKDAENDFKTESQEAFNGLASKVYDVLVSYVQQGGYTLVLDVSQKQNPVLYASESTNITKAVIDAYNVKSGVPAPPPASTRPAAAVPAAH